MSESAPRPSDEAPEPVDPESTAPSGSTARWLAAITGLVIVAFIVLLAFAGGDAADNPSRLVDQRVPAVEGVALNGESFNIDSHRGQWVLVNFFATWCPPCVAEHPDLVELEQWGADNGKLQVLSIVFDDQRERVAEFFEKNGGTWPVLFDPALAITFQVAQVPESFLVNPDGVVVAHVPGGITAADVRNAIGE